MAAFLTCAALGSERALEIALQTHQGILVFKMEVGIMSVHSQLASPH